MYHWQQPSYLLQSWQTPTYIEAPAFYDGQYCDAYEHSSYTMPYQVDYQPTADNFRMSYHSNKTQPRNNSITNAELNREIQKRIKRTLSHLADKREERLIQARKEASILNAAGGATRHLYLINLRIQEQNKEKNIASKKAYQEREAEIIEHQVRETIVAKYPHLPKVYCASYMPHHPKK
jgi:hypothetical protein